jgi:hypothetical protein
MSSGISGQKLKSLLMRHENNIKGHNESISQITNKFQAAKASYESDMRIAKSNYESNMKAVNDEIKKEEFYIKNIKNELIILDQKEAIERLERERIQLEETMRKKKEDEEAEVERDKMIQELIDEKVRTEGPFYIKQCDGCHQWDGISKRCKCGNRRIYWQYDSDDHDIELTYD